MSRAAHYPKAPAGDVGMADFHAARELPGAARRRVGDPAPKRCEVCRAPVETGRGGTWWCSASVGHPMGSGLPEKARGSLWARDGIAWGALAEKLPGRAEPAFKART